MKIDRLLNLTVYLLNRERASAVELADRFGVTKRTIYRDMETLSEAGFPVTATPGKNGGYGLLDSFLISRHTMSQDSVKAVLSALQSLQKTIQDDALDTAIEKIQNLLPSTQAENWNKGTRRLIIDTNPWGTRDKDTLAFQNLYQAVTRNQTAEITYYDTNGRKSTRVIEPLCLLFSGFAWYIFAWCRLRQEYRQFKLARIQNLIIQPEYFTPRADSGTALEGQKYEQPALVELTLKIDPAYKHKVIEYFPPEAMTELPDNSTLVKTSIPSGDWLYSFLMTFENHLEVISPENIRLGMKTRIENILKKYL